jgi:nitrite reductase/ring-hydroxylating ferredoxin subunit
MPRVLVGKRSDIQEGGFTSVTVGGRQILVAKIQGSYFATDNNCTHEGAELHEGELHNKQLICQGHGARWDLTTGQLIWFQELLESIGSYRIVIEGDTLFVDLEQEVE